MTKKERYKEFTDYFSREFPQADTELVFSNPFELLMAVVLAAQCTDKRINQISPALFERYPNPEALANSSVEEIFSFIRSVSYPNNKAKHLYGLGIKLVEKYGSEVPGTMEELQSLPGVGRKTANVILSVIYNQPAMAVDTHVFRVSHRLGLVSPKAKTPFAVETELVKNIPSEMIPRAHHWLILQGRYICLARKPQCGKCQITHFCKSFEKWNS